MLHEHELVQVEWEDEIGRGWFHSVARRSLFIINEIHVSTSGRVYRFVLLFVVLEIDRGGIAKSDFSACTILDLLPSTTLWSNIGKQLGLPGGKEAGRRERDAYHR